MKAKIAVKILFGLSVAAIPVMPSCQKIETVNQSPVVRITSPADGQEIPIGETITIEVNATDSDGSIAEVKFFIDNQNRGSATSPPFSFIWNTADEPAGSHTLKAMSFDNSGGSASDEISVELIESGSWTTGTFSDPRDGKTYGTITNGEQSWFSENLSFDTAGSVRVQSENGNVSGSYYTWQSALSACPAGWHLPTDEEWKALEMELHMLQSDADAIGWRGTVQGWWLKSKEGWVGAGNGTDRIGFNAKPDGYLGSDGNPIQKDTTAVFWTATYHSTPESAWYRQLHAGADGIRRSSASSTARFSVRCVKD